MSADPIGRVVVLRALGLGDLCTAVPALRGVRRHFPDHELVLLAPAHLASLARACGVDLVMDVRGPEFDDATVDALRSTAAVAINLHGRGPESTQALRRLRSPRLMSFGERPGPCSPDGPEWRRGEHDVVRWCRMLGHFGIAADPQDLAIPAPEPGCRVPPGTTVVHPGAAAAARRWPSEHFVEVIEGLHRREHRVALTGTGPELDLCRSIAHEVGRRGAHAEVVGRTSLEELCAVVAHARLVISNDTGVAHLATAFGTPSVVLFGPTPPSEWGPIVPGPHLSLWGGTRGDPHGPTPHDGLRRITVEAVLDAVDALGSPDAHAARTISPEVLA